MSLDVVSLQGLTDNALLDLLRFQLEDILLGTEIGLITRFHFENETFDEWTSVTCFRVRISIPGFLFDFHGIGGKNRFEPSRQMSFNMIDLESVLPTSTWSIGVRFVFDDFHATAGSIRFFSAFFLNKEERESLYLCTREEPPNQRSNSFPNRVQLG